MFYPSAKVAKILREREREARENYQWKYICELSWGKHCKFCTTEIRMFCKLIYQSFMPSAFLLLDFKWLIFLTVSGAWFC